MSSCSASKPKGLRVWFASPECSWAERAERCTARGCLSLAQLAGQRLCRVKSSGLFRLQGWWAGNWMTGIEHLRLFTARQSPLPWQEIKRPKRERHTQPPPPAGSQALPTVKFCKTGTTGPGTPEGCFRNRNTVREMPKGPIFELLLGRLHWFLGPYSTEASKAGRSEIGAARGNQDPAQP